jgi:hypothetical protein
MNSLTHQINPDGSLSRKPPKEGKRKKSRKPIRAKRSKPRKRKTVIRLDAAGMKALREERYEILRRRGPLRQVI